MRDHSNHFGRHRLGRTNAVHCIEIPAVALALADRRRFWLFAIFSQGRHSSAAMRRQPDTHSSPHQWIPAAVN